MMTFSEFIVDLKDPQICSAQPKQPKFLIHNVNSEIYPAQQKQCKQLVSNDRKDIFTHLFQPKQRLQPNFMTDSRKNSMQIKYNGDNPKVKIVSLIPQRQRVYWNFMTDSIRSFIHTNKQLTYLC